MKQRYRLKGGWRRQQDLRGAARSGERVILDRLDDEPGTRFPPRISRTRGYTLERNCIGTTPMGTIGAVLGADDSGEERYMAEASGAAFAWGDMSDLERQALIARVRAESEADPKARASRAWAAAHAELLTAAGKRGAAEAKRRRGLANA